MSEPDVLVFHLHTITQVLRLVCIFGCCILGVLLAPVSNSWVRGDKLRVIVVLALYTQLIQSVYTELDRFLVSDNVTARLPLNLAFMVLVGWIAKIILCRERETRRGLPM